MSWVIGAWLIGALCGVFFSRVGWGYDRIGKPLDRLTGKL